MNFFKPELGVAMYKFRISKKKFLSDVSNLVNLVENLNNMVDEYLRVDEQ